MCQELYKQLTSESDLDELSETNKTGKRVELEEGDNNRKYTSLAFRVLCSCDGHGRPYTFVEALVSYSAAMAWLTEHLNFLVEWDCWRLSRRGITFAQKYQGEKTSSTYR
jgi:hypothetical protein